MEFKDQKMQASYDQDRQRMQHAWGGDAQTPDGAQMAPQYHTCSFKGCAEVLPFQGFCPEHLKKVRTEPVDPKDLKMPNPNRPSAKNLAMLGESNGGDDFITASAREEGRLAHLFGQPGFEEPAPPPKDFNIQPAPLVGPDGQPISASSAVAAPSPAPSEPVPVAVNIPHPHQAPSPAPSSQILAPVVSGGGELKTAMAVYAALAALPEDSRGRVLMQVLDMFHLKPVPSGF
jgi:hypothetical protein